MLLIKQTENMFMENTFISKEFGLIFIKKRDMVTIVCFCEPVSGDNFKGKTLLIIKTTFCRSWVGLNRGTSFTMHADQYTLH